MEALSDVRTIVWLLIIFAGLVSGSVIMRVKLGALAETVEKMEERLVKKIDELRGSLKTLFTKSDELRDNHSNAIGDLRVVLTVMAGKLGNPGNDKELIEMIRDIGKKRNGR